MSKVTPRHLSDEEAVLMHEMFSDALKSRPGKAALMASMHVHASNDMMMKLLQLWAEDHDANPDKFNTMRIVGTMCYAVATLITQRTSTMTKECILAKAAGEYLHIMTHIVGQMIDPERMDREVMEAALHDLPTDDTKH